MEERASPVLGILRLDYDYPPALGDIDHPDTFAYDVLYRAVPGLTFAVCQSGAYSQDVKDKCVEAVEFLAANDVSGVTGDCGFMLNIQELVENHIDKPVFMSCLGQLHSILHSIGGDSEVAIFTANSNSLEHVEAELDRLSGLREHSQRLRIVGCQDVPGFDAVAKGEKVDVETVGPGVMELAKDFLDRHPGVKSLLLECTELPPYANALRFETGLPVYDAVSNCNAFMSGFLTDPKFGMKGWQRPWDGTHKAYHLGDNLSAREKADLKTPR